MGSVLALIDRKRFERLAPWARFTTEPGQSIIAIDRYVSNRRQLSPLEYGGNLYLVTVRPDEALWLVGVLERPTRRRGAWHAQPNRAPITDISAMRSQLGITRVAKG